MNSVGYMCQSLVSMEDASQLSLCMAGLNGSVKTHCYTDADAVENEVAYAGLASNDMETTGKVDDQYAQYMFHLKIMQVLDGKVI